MTFRPLDIVEATEPRDTERGRISVGERHTVQAVSASGSFIRLYGSDAFVRASGWKRIGRVKEYVG